MYFIFVPIPFLVPWIVMEKYITFNFIFKVDKMSQYHLNGGKNKWTKINEKNIKNKKNLARSQK
jgi:sterol desaturase/sphingolipid hydroxylase (fatty acid hydroxylase superfamily)